MQNLNSDMEAKQIIKELEIQDDLVCMLLEQNNCGIIKCRMDASLKLLFANQSFYQIIGYSNAEFEQLFHDNFMEVVHNVDRLDFKQKLRKAFLKKQGIHAEIRLKRKDGQPFSVSFQGMTGMDTTGNEYVSCIVKDISHYRKIEHQLRLQSERYHVLKKITNEPVFEYDDLSDTMMISYNKDGKDNTIIHNYRSEIQQNKYIHPDDVKQYLREFDESINNDKLSMHEFRTNLFDGDYVWYRAVYTTILDEESGMVKLIGKLENINAVKTKQQELQLKAMYDPMTKLLNRVTVSHQIEDYIESHPSGKAALLIIDIDNFKMVNDNLGHLFGDTVLINFAEELRKIYCDGELVGRIGGDEFMVFMPDSLIASLEEKADKTCHIFNHVYSGNLQEINVSTSIGISMYPKDAATYKQLFSDSDQALYESKQNGKNQFNYYNPEASEALADNEEQLLDHYKMENTREKRNDQATKDMIEFAFHILTETKDVLSGIGLVLESLCKRLDIQSGMIFEELDVAGGVRRSFCWTEQSGMQKDNQQLNFQEWNGLIELLKNGHFETQDMTLFKDIETVYEQLELLQAKSVCLEGIFDGDEVTGILLLVDGKREFGLNPDDSNMVHVILKIAASYLLQLRSNERINKKIDRLTNYDVVTGRYRFDKFKECVRKILDEAELDENYRYAIFYTDIRNFKNINDIYGYSVGDQVLYELSEIIRKRNDYVIGCRDFADNFISLMKLGRHDNIAFQIVRLEEEFNRSQQRLLRHSANLATGVYFIDDLSVNVSQMIDNANLARKHVKEELNRTYGFFDDKLAKRFMKNQQIESHMEDALQKGEFKIFLQPKYDLKTGHIVAAEALTRWQKPDQKYMFPDDFIPVFEKNGFITQVDFYVLEVVCKILRERIREHQPYVSISINQSRYLLHDETYVDKINHMIDQYDIPRNILEFELTESLFFEDSQSMIAIMHRLKQLDVAVSIDDFGSGYSSLNVLKDVPADIIKIDKEFLQDESDPVESKIIIRKTIEMAKELNKKVVCEGVETSQQADFLKEVGCDMVQGYLYAKPMPMDEFFVLLEKDRKKETIK